MMEYVVAGGKSITWLECEETVRLGKEIIPYLVDKDCDWPVHLTESYRTTEAIEKA